ncbi:hypothetical protein GN958_ATG06257 [Phytophthora infestans]|uniref:Uncharacterized protein n=1 Tax=Phytophthora infestans TaxID=4787 RepID=A0A8S9UVY3_PHYIN|nr:hypothetical protein GN958_ATG06257 [Phytophthora infestans]
MTQARRTLQTAVEACSAEIPALSAREDTVVGNTLGQATESSTGATASSDTGAAGGIDDAPNAAKSGPRKSKKKAKRAVRVMATKVNAELVWKNAMGCDLMTLRNDTYAERLSKAKNSVTLKADLAAAANRS